MTIKSGKPPKPKGKKRTLKQQKSSRARTSQTKGKSWQKVVAHILAYTFDMPEDEFFSNQGGDKGDRDVHQSSAARSAFPYWIECKNEKNFRISAWLKKLDEDREAAKCDEPGLIIAKLYGTSRALVMIELPDFLLEAYGPVSTKLRLKMRDQITEMIRNKPKKEGAKRT